MIIKRYNESVEWEELYQTIRDILLDLKDEGLKADLTVNKDYFTHLFLNLVGYEKPAKWEDLSSVIYRINEVVSGEFIPTAVYYKLSEENDPVTRGNRELETWEIFSQEMKNANPSFRKYKDNFHSPKVVYQKPLICFLTIEYRSIK